MSSRPITAGAGLLTKSKLLKENAELDFKIYLSKYQSTFVQLNYCLIYLNREVTTSHWVNFDRD